MVMDMVIQRQSLTVVEVNGAVADGTDCDDSDAMTYQVLLSSICQ